MLYALYLRGVLLINIKSNVGSNHRLLDIINFV